jgi:hypothetical protein
LVSNSIDRSYFMSKKNSDKICLLHIGAPKTGSTALQKFLTSNRKILIKLGWEYPEVSLRGFGHHDLAFLVSGGYPKWAIPQDRTFDELANGLKMSVAGKSRIILSSENFYLFPNPQGVMRMLAQAEFSHETVKIVVYIRRQDEVIASWYNQIIKAQGYTGTISKCIDENHDLWDYASRLDAWAEAFGSENLIVRPYQIDDLVEDDICRDFLNLADLPADGFAFSKEKVNTRINRDILEFQRLVNQLPLSPFEKRRFHKDLIALTSETASMNLFDDSPMLTSAERRQILSRYAESNTRLALTRLSRDWLFNENMPEESQPFKREKKLTVEKMAYILGWILAKRS